MRHYYVIVTRGKKLIALPAPPLTPGADEEEAAAVQFLERLAAIVRVEAVSEDQAIEEALDDLNRLNWFYTVDRQEPVQRVKPVNLNKVRVQPKQPGLRIGCGSAVITFLIANILIWMYTGLFLWEHVLRWLLL